MIFIKVYFVTIKLQRKQIILFADKAKIFNGIFKFYSQYILASEQKIYGFLKNII